MKKLLLTVALFIAGFSLAYAQKVITGKVSSQKDAAPLAGVSVVVQNGSAATQTDAEGNFSIAVPRSGRIIFSFVGYQTVEANVPAGNTLNVVLTEGGQQLSEVVVTALGIRRDKKALGYSVSTVDPGSVLQKSEPDIAKGLQGKVAGVDIRTSHGTPGGATRIQIRGNSSFGLDTDPLIVVDGIPYSNDVLATSSQTSGGSAYGTGLSNLDPNDIESMTVLKGAAAAALYGSRASRGALIITTKSGTARKGSKPLNITLKSGVSVERISNLPTYQNTYGSGANFDARTGSNGSWGRRFGSGYVYDQNGNILRPSTSGIDSIKAWPTYLAAYPELFDANGNTAYKPYPNNVADGFRTGLLYENSVGLNAGDGNTSLALTLSNTSHKGYVYNSSYTRNNVSVGAQTKVKGFTLGGNISYAGSKQIGGFFGNNQSPGASSQFARSLFMARNWDMFGLPAVDKAGQPLAFVAGNYDHPLWAAYHNTATTFEDRMVAAIRMGYKFNSWINFSYNFGVNKTDVRRDEVTDEFSRAASGLGRIVNDSRRATEIQSTAILTFSPKIGNTFTVDLKIGNDINQRNSRRQTSEGTDFIVPGIFNLANTVEKSFKADARFKQRIVGLFADATIGYKNFAFLNAGARNDRTSTLPFKNASYYYPAVSGSLIFTEALKLKSNWFDYGKVRVGWAKVGNDAPSQQGEDIFTLSTANFLGLPFASLSGLPFNFPIGQTNDPDLTPEFTSEIEAGFDLSFFKRRLNVEFTWYDKTSTDLIYPVSIPSSTGYNFFNTNIGKINNKGVEIGLSIKPVVTKDFVWELRGAFTKNENIVLELVDGLERANLGGGFAGGVSAWLEPGKPFGYLRGQVADRTADGQLLIDPQTGWIIEALEQGDIGDPNPDFKLGITNNFSYKGFTLSALFDMSKGGRFYSNAISSLLGRGVTKDTEDRETLWVIPGVYGNPNTHQPILSDDKPIQNQTRISTNDLYFGSSFGINSADEFQVYDATVYRLRELTLGYTFPKTVVSKLRIISDLTVTMSARNLWFLAPNTPRYLNYDPEVNAYGNSKVQGIELDSAPTTKRFGLNINATF